MQTKQSEEPRALSLQEMEEVNGGDAACEVAAFLIGGIWGFAVSAVAGPVAGWLVGGAVEKVVSAAAC